MSRYPGELFVDSVVDWVATSVVGLPRILYYSKETLVRFIIGYISCFFICIYVFVLKNHVKSQAASSSTKGKHFFVKLTEIKCY